MRTLPLHVNAPTRFWHLISNHLGWSPTDDQLSHQSATPPNYIRELKPLELLLCSCLVWGFSLVSHEHSSTMIIVTALAGLLIVPHGALDLSLARELRWVKHSSRRLGVFLMIYTVMAISFWIIWPYAPTLCLSIFWLMSIVHFGHNDTWHSSSSWVKWLSFLVCGTLPLIQSGFWDETEAMLLVTAMVPNTADVAAHLLKMSGYLWFVGAVFLAIVTVHQGKNYQRLLEVAVLVFTFAILTPELGFLVYGATIHAPRHVRHTMPRAIAAHPFGQRGLIWEIVATLCLTLALAVWALRANISLGQDVALIRLVFIGLAALTFPHMLLVDCRPGRWLTQALQ